MKLRNLLLLVILSILCSYTANAQKPTSEIEKYYRDLDAQIKKEEKEAQEKQQAEAVKYYQDLIAQVKKEEEEERKKQAAKAQKDYQDLILNVAADFSISASKPLLEANEFTTISVNYKIPAASGEAGKPTDVNDTFPADIGGESGYRAQNWKIVQGGGTLETLDEFTQMYQAPANAPAAETMVVSADLVPKDIIKGYGMPKVVLVQTLHFTKTETSFFLNFPQIGAHNSKYISKANAGIKVPTMQAIDPRVAARMSPEIRAKMKQAQAEIAAAQKSSGINLSAATSNAMALYDPQNNVTAIKLTTLSLQFNNGDIAKQTTGSGILEFSFKGKTVGTYSLDVPETGLSFASALNGTGGGCGNNNNSNEALCNGKVQITSVDDKTIKGKVYCTIYSIVGETLYSGFLYGKFTVNRAN